MDSVWVVTSRSKGQCVGFNVHAGERDSVWVGVSRSEGQCLHAGGWCVIVKM